MSILTQAEITQIKSDIYEIIGDDVISTDIVYRQTGTTVSAWSATSQLIPAMWTESSVSAFKGSYTLQEIGESGGLIEYGDVKFIIMTSAVTGILSVDDEVRESSSLYQSSTTYEIANIVRDPLDICFFLQGRAT